MIVKIFGKDACPVCKQMKDKFNLFINHWKINNNVQLLYHSLDNIDGLAEAAMLDATDVPAIIIENKGKEVARWTGKAVSSAEFKPYFDNIIGSK